MIGKFKARAKEWDLGISEGSGNEQIVVMFEITQGEFAGTCRTWYGSFSDAAIDRTLDSMRHCGWDGDSLGSIDGMGANEVELEIGEEEYKGKTRDKIKWVNRASTLMLKHQLTGPAREAFASKLRGKVVAHKQKYGAQPKPTQPAVASRPRANTQQPDDGYASGDPGYGDSDYGG